MEIVPYVGERRITASDFKLKIDPEDRTRAKVLVQNTSKTVLKVDDDQEFILARRAAAQLQGMLEEIETARKSSKTAFDAVGRSIQDLAHEVSTPVKVEQNRILKLLAVYVEVLEAAQKEKDRLEAEKRRKAQEEADRKVREAQEAQKKAEMELRAAKDEIERAQRREAAQKHEAQVLQQQLERELADEVFDLGTPKEPKRGLVPGGRVDHNYDFELVNVQATTDARCFRLLRWELDIRACQDSVRGQLECAPDIEPTLPGIKITKTVNVSVKAASRIK